MRDLNSLPTMSPSFSIAPAASRPMGVYFQRAACLMAGVQRGPSWDR